MKNKFFLASLAMAVAVPAVVAPVAASAEEVGFKDVTEKSYAYEAIMYLTKEGIVAGYGNGYFGLKDDVTRGQVSALITRYLKLDTSQELDNPYSDVAGTSFEKSILAVTKAGYMGGKGNGKFDPQATLTRAEMAVVLTNVFDLKVKADYQFHDMNDKHWASQAVKALYSNGITFGSGDYKYNPNQSVTREQYAEFLYRGIHLEEDYEAEPIPPKPEVKPDPKPEPEKPKPDPEFPEKPKNPKPSDLLTEKEALAMKPKDWTPDVLEKHKQQALEASKYRPGAAGSFGIGSAGLDYMRTPDYFKYLEDHLKGIKSSETVSDWVAAVNYVIQTGKAYTAPDSSYTLYAKYYTSIDPWTMEPVELVDIYFAR